MTWQSGDVVQSVEEVSPEPDERWILGAAEQFGANRDLEMSFPRQLRMDGLQHYLTSTGDSRDVTDYTLGWQPSTATSSTKGESYLALNVGSARYAQGMDAHEGEERALVLHDKGLSLEFKLAESSVRLSSNGIDEAELRAVARSLKPVSRDEWRVALGDRLVVDEPG